MRGIHLAFLALIALAPATARTEVIYNSIPVLPPTNLPSLGYEASGTAEFGDAVGLAGTSRALTSATVVLSNWALESTYEAVGTSAGYFVPLTLSLYNTGAGGANPVVGSLIARSAVSAFIPWRPEASQSCTGGGFQAPDGCFNGLLVPVTFDFAGVVLPETVIVGLSFSTTNHGASPTGVPGPYDSLNVAVSTGTTIGTDINPAGVEWNTDRQSNLTLGTAGVFGPEAGWAGQVPAFRLDAAIPEPSGVVLLLTAAIGLFAVRRRAARPCGGQSGSASRFYHSVVSSAVSGSSSVANGGSAARRAFSGPARMTT